MTCFVVRKDLYGAFVFQYKWKLQDIYFFHVQACLLIFKYLPDESHYKNQIIYGCFFLSDILLLLQSTLNYTDLHVMYFWVKNQLDL